MVGAPSRRDLVSHLKEKGLSERKALRIIDMSASSCRYQAVPDKNMELKAQRIALGQR